MALITSRGFSSADLMHACGCVAQTLPWACTDLISLNGPVSDPWMTGHGEMGHFETAPFNPYCYAFGKFLRQPQEPAK